MYSVLDYLREHTIVDPANIAMLQDVICGYRVECMRRGIIPPQRQAIVAELQPAGYKMGATSRANGILGISFYPRPRWEQVGSKLVRNSPAGMSAR
jgi:hypothetical protein